MAKRSTLILEYLESRQAVSYKDLAKTLRVSTMTIRRECAELAREGSIIRTFGGIQRKEVDLVASETTTAERMRANNCEKQAIAGHALGLIRNPCTVFLDGSTTCLALAKLIDAKRNGLTVVTHSPLICLALTSGRNTVICSGGEFDPRSLCLVGSASEGFAASILIDIAFISTTGLLPDTGAYESDPATFRVKQAIAPRASARVLLADHTKFYRRALSKVLDISQITYVITDDQVPEPSLLQLRAAGVNVIVARSVEDRKDNITSSNHVNCNSVTH